MNQSFPLAGLCPKPNPFEMRKKSQKATLVVCELLASIIILYSPYYIFVIAFGFYRKSHQIIEYDNKQYESTETVLNIIIYLIQSLMLCSPTLNAILYGFKNKTIQENIHNIWRKRKTKIELHYEIQARTPSTCGSRKASLTEVTTNLPNIFQPQLKRQLSEFFFGTSSSLMSHLNDDISMYHSKIYRTPSDSMFNSSCARRSSHLEFLSPNFDPLGKMQPNVPANSPSSPGGGTKLGVPHSASKNLLNNFKKLIVGSKNDLQDDTVSHDAPNGIDFPKILITKHDSLLNTQSTSRRVSSDIIQQVAVEEELAEKEPLLTAQTHSLENVNFNMSLNGKKFQTL
jgi:hypothetical protein